MKATKKLLGVGLIFGAAAIGAGPSAQAATVVSLGNVSTFTGPGGLDLTGQFNYAINFSNNDPNRVVNGVTFLHDRQVIPGATLTGPNEVTPWQTTPSFGATADDNELEQIMADIRWANSGANQILRADLAVTPGSDYKLQVMWDGNQAENRRWDILFEGLLAVDGVTSNGLQIAGDAPGAHNPNGSVLWTHSFTATDSIMSVIFDGRQGAGTGNSNNGAFTGGMDANPIWQALTLEQIIPEPASVSLLGMAGLGLLRRRSRTTA